MKRPMKVFLAIFLAMAFKGMVMALYQAITGREAFPANPKGPLYRWFGKPNHSTGLERLKQPPHVPPKGPLVVKPGQQFLQCFRVSKPPQ